MRQSVKTAYNTPCPLYRLIRKTHGLSVKFVGFFMPERPVRRVCPPRAKPLSVRRQGEPVRGKSLFLRLRTNGNG